MESMLLLLIFLLCWGRKPLCLAVNYGALFVLETLTTAYSSFMDSGAIGVNNRHHFS